MEKEKPRILAIGTTDAVLKRLTFRTAIYRAQSAGFSLLELLSVVVIIAVLAAALTLSISLGGPERRLQHEAERLQALLAYACERSELTGRNIGFNVVKEGYAFSEHSRDSWTPVKTNELRRRQWPKLMSVSLLGQSGPITLPEEISEHPQVVCFSSGELTPFRLELALGEAKERYRLVGESNGELQLQRLDAHGY